MKEQDRQNLKGLSRIIIILGGAMVGTLSFVEGCSKFDRWYNHYLQQGRMKEYQKQGNMRRDYHTPTIMGEGR